MKKYIILMSLLILSIIISAGFVEAGTMFEYRIYGGIITIVLVVITWICMWKDLFKSEPKAKKTIMSDRYIDISKEEMQSYGINIYDFKEMVFKKFVDIHMDFSNFDFDNLKLNLTNDLYNYYIDELNIMKENGIVNVIKDIELIDVKIYKVINVHQILRVSVYLNVRMFDYMYDINYDKCISGNQTTKTSFEYELVFENRGNGHDLNNQFLLSQKNCINEMSIKNVGNVHEKK